MNAHERIIISGGGTGGHIVPALAIAAELQARDPNINLLFVGAIGRMEMKRIPAQGYKIKGIWISGFQRRFTLKNILFPLKLIVSLVQSFFIIKKFNPQAVIGTGGFASGPLLYVASLLNIPTLIHEQNSYPGITNRLLGKMADRICVAYENMERYFPQKSLYVVGNPTPVQVTTKQELSEQSPFATLNQDRLTLVILGGSLGAKVINEHVAKNLENIKEIGYQLIWQTGVRYYDTYKSYKDPLNGIVVQPFIENISEAYQLGHVFVSRAGALSISELCLVGKPVVFIPSPNVAEDHQFKNAKILADHSAAVVLREEVLADQFTSILQLLATDRNKREEMSKNIRQMATNDAAQKIVNILNELTNECL